jgi:hypothetical protein
MRLLIAGALATATAAGLAVVRPAVLREEERAAALAIREYRMRADLRFLAGSRLEQNESSAQGDRRIGDYLAARFEALGLEPGRGTWWERSSDGVGTGQAGLRPGAGVIGLLPGRDPALSKEAIVYTSRAPGLASLLAVAEAFATAPERPRRSILFAAEAGDERGCVDWELQAGRPPGARPVAALAIDGTDAGGRVRDVHVAGLGETSLDDWIRAVAETQGRTVVPVHSPSDAAHGGSDGPGFSRVGVPTVGVRVVTGDGAGSLSGAVEDARLLFLVGAKLADAPLAPSWRPSDELEAAARRASVEGGR